MENVCKKWIVCFVEYSSNWNLNCKKNRAKVRYNVCTYAYYKPNYQPSSDDLPPSGIRFYYPLRSPQRIRKADPTMGVTEGVGRSIQKWRDRRGRQREAEGGREMELMSRRPRLRIISANSFDEPAFRFNWSNNNKIINDIYTFARWGRSFVAF